MNSEIIKPTNGGELRELARKSPEDALFFLKKNLNIWNEIAIADPVSYTHLTLPTIYSV